MSFGLKSLFTKYMPASLKGKYESYLKGKIEVRDHDPSLDF